MSGSESYMLNAAVSDVQQSQSQNSVPLAYTAADGTPVYTPPPISTALYAAPPPMDMTPPPPYLTAVYAPPMDMVPPHPKSPSPTPVTYQPDTGASGGSDVAEAVVQPSVKNNNGNNNTGEGTKRRRGRPRKYPPSTEGFTAAPTAPAAPAAMGRVYSGKKRGRPAGSRKKQRAAPAAVSATGQVASGLTGAGLTAYVVTVEAGEDVLAKLMSFSQRNTQAVCVLSANGTISNVTLERAATCGGTVTIEGRFEILSLSGSFLLSEYGGQRSRTGGLSVSLAGPDGRVLGGGVAGLLMAASPVRVIVGSFAAGGQQQPTNPVGSPPSRATISGSSGGPGSPLNHSTGGYNSIPQTTGNVAWNAPSY